MTTTSGVRRDRGARRGPVVAEGKGHNPNRLGLFDPFTVSDTAIERVKHLLEEYKRSWLVREPRTPCTLGTSHRRVPTSLGAGSFRLPSPVHTTPQPLQSHCRLLDLESVPLQSFLDSPSLTRGLSPFPHGERGGPTSDSSTHGTRSTAE